jgi:pimeloyl-ACP methyl ester carboxylesterase
MDRYSSNVLRLLVAAWLTGGTAWGTAWCQEASRPGLKTAAENLMANAKERISFPSPRATLEHAVAWTDQLCFHRWRIQQHVDTHVCRLLDDEGEIELTGTFDECRTRLELIKLQRNLPPLRGRAVLLLHGLAAPAWSMQRLANHLEKRSECECYVIEYASLRSSVDDQAHSLAQLIQYLDGIDELQMVGHSLGNIVIRRYLAGDQDPRNGWRADRRVSRVVMLAPPNHGSSTADWLSDNSVFKTVFGESGRQLGVEWTDLEKRLAIPDCEFGIIAGGWKNPVGLNPFLPGDDDGRITVVNTRLPGATDFRVVPQIHEFMAHDPQVLDYTLNFLLHGHFISADQREPIPRDSLAEQVHPRWR